ncbi:hypothetical protein BDV95DRAFT_165337 [Massariosphaeria phaeospora]|uniref:Uncharacterized protein n=1 Tax=Massariosphaeria phaeospora TaxID=100035 RepID=A0A7C8MF56_9PLEO|nr:hypothetical protein BDV95DRAFT_165337 [Massariosphaeria phaeospora]
MPPTHTEKKTLREWNVYGRGIKEGGPKNDEDDREAGKISPICDFLRLQSRLLFLVYLIFLTVSLSLIERFVMTDENGKSWESSWWAQRSRGLASRLKRSMWTGLPLQEAVWGHIIKYEASRGRAKSFKRFASNEVKQFMIENLGYEEFVMVLRPVQQAVSIEELWHNTHYAYTKRYIRALVVAAAHGIVLSAVDLKLRERDELPVIDTKIVYANVESIPAHFTQLISPADLPAMQSIFETTLPRRKPIMEVNDDDFNFGDEVVDDA